jgi:two-component sensor histidine kinase
VMVDDSTEDRRLYRTLLAEAYTRDQAKPASGLDFADASTGQEGLRLCQTLAPDCVLLNHELPDMTGMEFLARLKAGSPNDDPAYAVVMLTGLSSERIAVEALKMGAQDYLLKDRVTADSLSLAVNKATGKVGLIRALKAERDRLAASLAEKEVLLKEVHHRVKNNLQVIASLLRLQIEVMQDGHLIEALRESQHRVESMALIHEQLYETADLREVDLCRHASLLMNKLFNAYGVDATRIHRHVNIPPLPLAVNRAIPAGLILNELISNALKHAFPGQRTGHLEVRGGRVNTSSRGERDTQVFFEVSDDGVGLSAEIEIARPRSLGLEIVNILARQLQGVLTLERAAGPRNAARNQDATFLCGMALQSPGTCLRVTFPGF